MKVWRGFLVLSLAVVAAFGLLGLAGCGDDAGGSSGGSSGNNTGIGGDESPFIAIYAGSTPVKLTSDKDEASLIPVNLSSFCNPDLDETCDVSAPENNEYKITFIHVENTGGATLKISEFSVDNPEYFEIRSQNGTPVPSSSADAQLEIAPSGEDGDSQYFDIVMFRPPEGLAPSTVITLRSNSDRNDGDLVLINVRAEGLAPKIQAPSNVDFDSVSQGDIQNESISILNTGTGDLEISKFVLTGHPAFTFIVGPPFMNEVKKWPVSQETASQGITFDSPIVVSPGTAATVNVQFVPEGPEPATANLILFSNDADAKSGTLIKISGNQKGPCVTGF